MARLIKLSDVPRAGRYGREFMALYDFVHQPGCGFNYELLQPMLYELGRIADRLDREEREERR